MKFKIMTTLKPEGNQTIQKSVTVNNTRTSDGAEVVQLHIDIYWGSNT